MHRRRIITERRRKRGVKTYGDDYAGSNKVVWAVEIVAVEHIERALIESFLVFQVSEDMSTNSSLRREIIDRTLCSTTKIQLTPAKLMPWI